MILEIRIYRIRAGMRDRFIDFFESKTLAPQRAAGMEVLGQFRSLDDPNLFVWLRRFDDAEARDRQKAAFYEGALWKDELEDEAFSMIEDYSNVLLVEPTAHSAIQ